MKRAALFLSAAALTGCATVPDESDIALRAQAAFAGAFAGGDAQILARVEHQDDVQVQCSKYRNAPPLDVAQLIERTQRAAIRYPIAGGLIGDWKQGNLIAEDGSGMRYGDNAGRPSGGNCYACHRLTPQEIAYGTVGPSLLGYGVSRGASEAMQRLTYERIYNAQAFNACSAMPRFGHNQVLTPEQIAHLVALLLDPESPVNTGKSR